MLDLTTSPVLQPIEQLVAHITRDDGKWPMECEEPILRKLNTWAAIYENDRDQWKKIAGWQNEQGRPYKIDPLGERIADAWAAYLWGEDPRVLAGDENDQEMIDQLLGLDPAGGGGVLLASELERAAGVAVAEGEVWARIYTDSTVAPRPLLEWHSRRCIVPLWVGSRLVAAALVTELPDMPDDGDDEFRHFEVHAPGVVVNLLYRGTDTKLGHRVELTDHPASAVLDEVWQHGLPGMLLERIPNRLRRTTRLGVSDYEGILDFLTDLNEVATIGSVNMRLTARKRAVISSAVADAQRNTTDETLTPEEPGLLHAKKVRFDPAEDVFVEDALDAELGRSGSSPYRVLEYSFDAEPLIAWQRNLIENALSRAALTGQYVGAGDPNVGYAISGTAIRLRLIPTDKAGRAKARYWEDGLPRILANMVRLDALPMEKGGFGRAWTNPEATPVVQRQPGLPVDGLEEAQRHSLLISAGVESIESAVRDLHSDWDEERVQAEVEAIRADKRAVTPGGAGSLLGV